MNTASWLDIPPGSHLSLANVPFGIISTSSFSDAHAAIAIGNYVLDLYQCATHGGFSYLAEFSESDIPLFSQPTLNDFAAADNEDAKKAALYRRDEVTNHAYNCGCIFRDPQKALQPNYLHLPVPYSSRALSVVPSGTPIRRPLGQWLANPGDSTSSFGPCRSLDIELELGALLCKGNKMGEPIPRHSSAGAVLLGPFNAKNFASSITPWVVLKDAIEPFHAPGILNDTPLHPYLQEKWQDNVYDIHLEVEIKKSRISFAQMLAHHTVGGCPMQVGDLLGSGTISGTEKGTLGSFLGGSAGGKEEYPIGYEEALELALGRGTEWHFFEF
ncbi:hypothetical protein BDV11DRAFT_201973 [Aspergillus similis]